MKPAIVRESAVAQELRRVSAEQRAHKETPYTSLREQLHAIRIAQRNPENIEFERLQNVAAASGMGSTVTSDGGFLLQPELSEKVFVRSYQIGQILSRCTRYPVSVNRNGLTVPAFDETSRANGQRLGGVQVYWADEATTATASKPKFRQVNLPLQKLIGIYYATEELEEDSAAFDQVLIDAFAAELTFVAEDAIIAGTFGLLGLLKSKALIVVTKESAQATGTFVAANVQKMSARLYASADPSGVVWLIQAELMPQVKALAPGLYVAPVGGDDAAPYGRLDGRPIVYCESCSAVGAQGDVLLVDLTEYLVADRTNKLARSIHVRFLQGENAFRATYRVAGAPIWAQPVTPKNGSLTVSPIVTLEARP